MVPCAADWHGWWRPSTQPVPGLGFGARSVGRGSPRPGWRHPGGTIRWHNLYWGGGGVTPWLADGQQVHLADGQFIVHPPGTRIGAVRAEQAGWYRWCTLDGPLVPAALQALRLDVAKLINAGPCPVALFDQLELLLQQAAAGDELEAERVVYAILVKAAGGARSGEGSAPNDPAARCVRHIRRGFRDPTLTVADLARALSVDRSVLSRAFRRRFGIPPSGYLQRLRLQEGLRLLTETTMPVAQIAGDCGFSDPAYFSRCVSRCTGLSPRTLRRH